MFFLCAFVGVIIFYIFCKWANENKMYFAQRNIKFLQPRFLFGNTAGLYLRRYAPTNFFDSLYYRFPKEKLIGYFDMREPIYLARDADLIRHIAIRDFDNFEDHAAFIESDSDTLFGKSLCLLSEKKWRDMRGTLSPAFTGNKMRPMFELVVECAEYMAKYLIDDVKQDKSIRWEMKELFSRYTSDVIASCAFGMKVNSFKHPSNEFFSNGKNSSNFGSVKVALRLLVIRLLPKLTHAIDFELFPHTIRRYFKTMILDTMKERQEKHIFRPDMINILMKVRDGHLKQPTEMNSDDAGFATVQESHIGKVQVKKAWSDDEIVAQCFLFFAAGFETTSTLMSFLSYELALNPDIQQKLFDEIRTVNAELNGDRLSYDTLPKLKYLDQVISEALRKWPPQVFINRKCTKDYECNLDGNKFIIERGKSVWISIYSIHHDRQIYENPTRFNPDRFSDENKHKIKAGTYIPFGIGPRNCIGSRFALMEIKALFFYLLLNFRIQAYEKTQIPLNLAKSATNLAAEKGIHLELRPRV